MAALKKAYAKACGVTEKCARDHARKNHPDWQRFVGQAAVESVTAPSPATVAALAQVSPMRPPVEPVAVELDASLPEPVYMERAHKAIWEGTFHAWERARRQGDEMLAAVLVQQLPKLRESYEKARRDREAWEVSMRNLIPTGQVYQIASEFGVPLRNKVEGMDNDLAPRLCPEDPDRARRVIREWQEGEMFPVIDAFIEAIKAAA